MSKILNYYSSFYYQTKVYLFRLFLPVSLLNEILSIKFKFICNIKLCMMLLSCLVISNGKFIIFVVRWFNLKTCPTSLCNNQQLVHFKKKNNLFVGKSKLISLSM